MAGRFLSAWLPWLPRQEAKVTEPLIGRPQMRGRNLINPRQVRIGISPHLQMTRSAVALSQVRNSQATPLAGRKPRVSVLGLSSRIGNRSPSGCKKRSRHIYDDPDHPTSTLPTGQREQYRAVELKRARACVHRGPGVENAPVLLRPDHGPTPLRLAPCSSSNGRPPKASNRRSRAEIVKKMHRTVSS
jgi:hypothetical protein